MTLAIVLAEGCADNSYPGYFYDEEYASTVMPIPIKILLGSADDMSDMGGVSSRRASCQVKGAGEVSDKLGLNDKDFYIYAFNTDLNTDMEMTSEQNKSWCLIDGSLDSPDSELGKLGGRRAGVIEHSNIVSWRDSDDYIYWPSDKNSGVVYNIFAYYVDDASVTDIVREHDKVILSVEIDGSQDIMSSMAELTDEQKSKFTNENELAQMQNYCYGYRAAQRGINPVLNFKHHLSKLVFSAKPGVTEGESNEVTIKSIEVKSRYKADFCVATKNGKNGIGLDFKGAEYSYSEDAEIVDDDRRFFSVREENGDVLSTDKYVLHTLKEPATVEPLKIGGGLLTAPDSGYDVYIKFGEKKQDGSLVEEKVNRISLNTGFNLGNSYKISLTVYGNSRVDVSVELEKWLDGGGYYDGKDSEPIPDIQIIK